MQNDEDIILLDALRSIDVWRISMVINDNSYNFSVYESNSRSKSKTITLRGNKVYFGRPNKFTFTFPDDHAKRKEAIGMAIKEWRGH